MSKKVYIALGSNQDNRMHYLRIAVQYLQAILINIQTSIVIETQAIVIKDDKINDYLNMVVCGSTTLDPINLLYALKDIEKKMGRIPNKLKWQSRIIDLDILLYEDYIINSEQLTIPHIELKNRPFLMHLLALLQVPQYEYQINSFKKSFTLYPTLMGIVNVTNDSFSDGGLYYDDKLAIKHANELYKQGATIIDIGAQSTKPNAIINDAKTEINRLKNVIPYIDCDQISIDTFQDEVVEWVLNNHTINIINDVKGILKNKTLKMINRAKAKICIMHSLSIPPRADEVLNDNFLKIIYDWGQNKIHRLLDIGFTLNDIIFDPGIGFGKTIQQNFDILKNLQLFKMLNVKLLVGHSRKSYLSIVTNSNPKDRDIETIMISNMISKNVDFLRIHDIYNHMRAFTIQQVNTLIQ